MSTQENAAPAMLAAGIDVAPISDRLLAIVRKAGHATWECIAAYHHRRALRKAEQELMMLDDRMLHDIGLTRGGIPAAVRRAEAHHLMSIVPH